MYKSYVEDVKGDVMEEKEDAGIGDVNRGCRGCRGCIFIIVRVII
jgi:hypothetical protein